MSSLFSFGFTKPSQDGGSAKKNNSEGASASSSSSQATPPKSKSKAKPKDFGSSSSKKTKSRTPTKQSNSKSDKKSASKTLVSPPPPPLPAIVGKRVNGKTGSKRACLNSPTRKKKSSNDDAEEERDQEVVDTAANVDAEVDADAGADADTGAPESQGEKAVGRRLKLYWKAEKKWYSAKITSHVHNKTFIVLYKADGVEEQLDLDKEKIEWLPQESKSGNDKKRKMKGNKKEKKRSKSKKPVKRLRRLVAVISDDDDSSGEEECDMSDDGIDESEESAYSDGDVSGNDDDDDDDDDESVVMDDNVSEVGQEEEDDEEEEKHSKRRSPQPKPRNTMVSPIVGRFTPNKPSSTPMTTTPIRPMSTPSKRTPGKSPMFGSTLFNTPGSSRKNNTNPAVASQMKVGVLGFGEHEHHQLPWLQEDKVKDMNGRKPTDPEYDSTTLYVPDGYLRGEPKYHGSNPRKITPGLQAYWGFKAVCADAVIFYKVGKFYELYHMDADIGVQHLDCVYMKGDTAHCGFPEIAYGKYSERLVDLGFRVTRVEQTETPEQMKIRTGKASGCVRREICAILSPGTRTLSVRDGNNRPLSVGPDADARVQLLAVVELPLPVADDAASVGHNSRDELLIGVTLLDPTTGRFRVGCFNDDANRFNLRTLLAQERPAEVCFTNGVVTANTLAAIKYEVPANGPLGPTLYTRLASVKTQVSVEASAKHASTLLTETYFSDKGSMPPALAQMLAHIHLPQVVASLGALGVCLQVLQRAYIDHELVTLGDLTTYTLPGCTLASTQGDDGVDGSSSVDMDVDACANADNKVARIRDIRKAQVMVMDGMALANLEVLESNASGNGKEGSLLAYLDRCVTSFGKRRLRGWLSKPLFSAWAIRQRQEQVVSLVSLLQHSRLENGGGKGGDVVSQLRTELKHVPDLERLVSRIHALGMKAPEGHPDARAVVYDIDKHNKIKIDGLVAAIKGLKVLHGALNNFSKALDAAQSSVGGAQADGDQDNDEHTLQSSHIKSLRALIDSATPPGATLSDVKDSVTKIENSFDMKKSAKYGFVDPTPGCSQDYDDAEQSQTEIKELLDQELEKERNVLQEMAGLSNSDTKRIVFFDGKMGKDQLCQITVPTSIHGKDRDVPKHWQLLGKAKAHCRYHTKVIKKLIMQLGECNARAEIAKRDVTRVVFLKFDQSRAHWASVVECAAQLDCLVSLALVSADSTDESPMVRPTIRDPPPSTRLVPMSSTNTDVTVSETGELPMLRLIDSRHPCVADKLEKSGEGTFIPNDITIGNASSTATTSDVDDKGDVASEGERCLLLTGPNMGGKSTLLRQSCIAVIMAQIGCYVPARECELTPVDRIFTRVGASDRIMQGQSTFYVELSETNTILHKASRNSLAILDELGRGTSTFDGTAIAFAVLKELHDVGCRVLFATHYHSLVQDLKNESGVSLGHMSCVADESDSNDTEGMEEVATSTPTPADSRVTFLYKLAPGPSDKSYGLNVARLARLPSEVISKAHVKSEEFETGLKRASGDHRTTTCEALLFALSAAAAMTATDTEKNNQVLKTIMGLWEQMNAHQ